jgi:hypothetical protein
MRRLSIAILLVTCPAFSLLAQTTAPPLCPEGQWPIHSSRSASGWDCTNQTTSGDQSSDSGSSQGRHHHRMSGGGNDGSPSQ